LDSFNVPFNLIPNALNEFETTVAFALQKFPENRLGA